MRNLTVELNKDKDEVFIHGSPEGLRYLAQQLNVIAAAAERDGKSHDHFMTAVGRKGTILRATEWHGERLSHQSCNCVWVEER